MDSKDVAVAIRRAELHLAAADPVMGRLIAAHGPCPLAERKFQPFYMLANSIISQQLSAAAAASIKLRVGALVGVPFQPEKVLATPAVALRAAGLSDAKVRYIQSLAAAVVDGRVRFTMLRSLDDEAVIEKLIPLPGVGRWTAEMFLIFALKRLDVLSLGDAGLQRAAHLLYGRRHRAAITLPRAAAPWRPYRSVASWYLWRSLEKLQSELTPSKIRLSS